MNQHDFTILSADFQPLKMTTESGWVMRVSGTSRNIIHRAVPFVMRVGFLSVRELAISLHGDRFEGFLESLPLPGDQLYAGYDIATHPTGFVYGMRENTFPSV